MSILELFAEKYLNYYDVQSPLNTDIVSNGNCFFHALEYANGDVTQDRAIHECIEASRRDVTDLYINLLDSSIESYREALQTDRRKIMIRKLEESIKTNKQEKKKMELFKNSKDAAKEAVIRQGVIHKEKALFILKTDQNDPASLSFQILTTEKIGINFNINNILFLINETSRTKGVHFITFRNSDCRRVVPNRLFIEIMNEIIRIPEIATYGGIGPDNIMEFIVHIQDFDRAILQNVRIKLNSPPVAQGLSLSGSIEEEYKKMAFEGSPHSTVSSITNPSYNQSPEGLSLSESLKEADARFSPETPENQRRFTRKIKPRKHTRKNKRRTNSSSRSSNSNSNSRKSNPRGNKPHSNVSL